MVVGAEGRQVLLLNVIGRSIVCVFFTIKKKYSKVTSVLFFFGSAENDSCGYSSYAYSLLTGKYKEL